MSKYIYSPSQNAFYPVKLSRAYKLSGTWPTDGKEVADEIYIEYAAKVSPPGKIREAGEDGMPSWVDAPVPTPEEAAFMAESKKSTLMKSANNMIAPLQDAADLIIATESELKALAEWKKYRVLLSRIDTTKPPEIEWPPLPNFIS
ncbi:tail fiber assembly protein [Buttiauxella agrestis]|uniref:tail fiber assembly protein n=1 Tax=Buttiauxella agrestis TaxID=82977 RepID=UPI000E202382|nr:tail fiber assembly protein [Buttiauxella agrestis]